MAKKGWSFAKEPLKKFIIENGDSFTQSFFSQKKESFENNNIQDYTSKMISKNGDIDYVISYVKYLESKKEIDKSLNIYKNILENNINVGIKNIGMIKLIFQLVTEVRVTNNLSTNIKNNIYTKEQKKLIHFFLRKNLLLDEKLFFIAIDEEIEMFNKECISLLKALKDDNYILSSTNIIKNKNINMNTVYERVYKNVTNMKYEYHKKISQITNKKQEKDLEDKYKEETAVFKKEILDLQNKSIEEIQNLKENPKNYINALTKFIYLISLPKYASVKLQLIERIELNKKLLTTLSEQFQYNRVIISK